MPTVLITGANRGLGLEYARQYSEQGWQVIACARKTDSPELAALDPQRTQIHALDVTDHAAVDALATELAGTAIDVLVNNAGTTGPKGAPECMEYSGVDNMDYAIAGRDVCLHHIRVVDPQTDRRTDCDRLPFDSLR